MRIILGLFVTFLAFSAAVTASAGPGPFVYGNALSPHGEWGKLHQMPDVNATDFSPHYSVRFPYYFMGRSTLERDPAYVAAVQRDLRRLGYYCGEVDGIYSDEISEAIAKLQKNYGLQVTGTLNVAVRRALHLP
ncbi:MAG: peptidoglycan-binding domain-containing protein [Chthoniobacterales bacterium]